jgi:hypothetical protein
MVLRVVLIQLKPEHSTDAKVREIAKKALEVLPHAARAMEVKVHTASDQRTRDDWDLCILVRFASMQDPPVYRVDPIHRSFADKYLKPLRERIYVYHFEDHVPLIPVTTR